MRTTVFLLFSILAAGPFATRASAQVTSADSAAVLLEAARTFQDEGRPGVAEALFLYITERWGATPAGLEAQAALRVPTEEGPNRSSRVELQVWSTLYGAWLGLAIPAAFGADDPGPYGAGLLLGGPGGFFAGRAMGRSRPMSEGQVRALTFGSLWGTWQGFGWAEVGDWGEREICDFDYCYVEDPDAETVFRSMIVGGLAGTGIGWLLSRKPITSGVASSANFGAFWGTWVGLAGGIITDLEGDGLLTTTLLGGNAGLIAGALGGSHLELSRNRARLISIAGVVGGLAGAGLDLIIQPDDEKVAVAIPFVTSMIGLGLGTAYTSDPGRSSEPRLQDSSLPGSRDGPGFSLLEVRNGTVQTSLPTPYLTAVAKDTPRGTVWKPGLGVTLFHARF
jgi:hypothetical protein